jgi:glycosyltransferase involved in cell wall biosynthesis
MKILIVSEVFYPENFIVNDLALEWKAMGHTVDVLTQYPSYPQSYVYEGYTNKGYTIEEWEGIRIHRFPVVEGYKESITKKLRNYLRFVKEGGRIAKRIEGSYDYVFVSQTGPLTVALPAFKIKKRFNVPVAIWTQDIWPDAVWSYGIPKNFITKFFLDRFIRNTYKKCDTIFISSKKFAETINKFVDKECIYTPNWLKPTVEEISSLRLDKEKFNFTFTGNISRYQNLQNVVLGFKEANLQNAVLNIVGNGSYAETIKSLIKKENIKNVVMHGSYPYNQMNDILTQSDMLVLPLIPNEGIMKTEPFKIQSYLHSGKPIFGVLGGSGKDIIEENMLGICSNPNNIDDIAEGFRKCIDFAKENSEKVKIASQELMCTRFNKEKIVERFTTTMENNKR